MYTESTSRRHVLSVAAGIAIATGLAGCLDDDEDDDEPDDTDDVADDPVDMDAVDDHLADANGYEGDLQDHRGEDTIEITVGDPDGGSNYLFDPVAPEIDAGTTVEWTWIDDASHSVTHEADDREFDSDIQDDYEFEHTFEDPGTYLYICQPHQAQGHLGAVIVH